MRNIKASRVVAFDSLGAGILCPVGDWAVEIDTRSKAINLKTGKHRLTYDLTTQVVFLGVADQKEEVALGKTLGRMALTGIATNGFAAGKGVPGAVMDLALRGSERNLVVAAWLITDDTTAVEFEATAEEFKKLCALLPASAISNAGYEKAKDTVALVERMKLDGPRVVDELGTEIERLVQEIALVQQSEDSGQSFQERDASRMSRQTLQKALVERKSLRKAVTFNLSWDAREAPGRNWTKTIGSILFVVVCVVAFMAYATKKPATVSAELPRINSGNVVGEAPVTDKGNASAAIGSEIPQEITVAPSMKIDDSKSTNQPAITTALGPSFDCTKAATPVEKMICDSAELAEVDQQLAATYKKALGASNDVAAMRKAQNAWRREARDICRDAKCVMDAYRTKLAELSQK